MQEINICFKNGERIVVYVKNAEKFVTGVLKARKKGCLFAEDRCLLDPAEVVYVLAVGKEWNHIEEEA